MIPLIFIVFLFLGWYFEGHQKVDDMTAYSEKARLKLPDMDGGSTTWTYHVEYPQMVRIVFQKEGTIRLSVDGKQFYHGHVYPGSTFRIYVQQSIEVTGVDSGAIRLYTAQALVRDIGEGTGMQRDAHKKQKH